jgi:hypothetical protein
MSSCGDIQRVTTIDAMVAEVFHTGRRDMGRFVEPNGQHRLLALWIAATLLTIPLAARGAASLSVTPASVDVGSFYAGAENGEADAIFAVKNISGADVFVTFALHGSAPAGFLDCAEPELNARRPFYLHAGETCTQDVFISQQTVANGPIGPGQIAVDYFANGVQQTSATVTWSLLPPVIVISPDPIAMGPTQVGQSTTKAFTLTNATNNPLTLTVQFGQVQLTDCQVLPPLLPAPIGLDVICVHQQLSGGTSLFATATGCQSVQPHASCAVNITFSPNMPLPTRGALTVISGSVQMTERFDAIAVPSQTVPGTVLAVEFVEVDLLHFFSTAIASEIAALDDGQFPGWVRTGRSFWVYPSGASIAPNESPVCRYFTTPNAGFNTHFYSAFPQECDGIPTLFPGLWTLETTDAFGVQEPNTITGACPLGTSPLYRLYNGGPNVNHRYVTDTDTRQEMLNRGWIPEGYGPLGVGMCLP